MRGITRGPVAALTVAAFLIAGCGSLSSSSSSSSSAAPASSSGSAKSSSPIVIGAAIAKTGLLSAYDLPAWTAFQMEVANANAAGGIDGHQI